MDGTKREKLLKLAQNEEDRLFLAKLLDKADQSDKGYLVCTHFMDPHQRTLARRLLKEIGITAVFDGGYDSAERVVGMFMPDYMAFDNDTSSLDSLRKGSDYPLSLVEVTYRKNQYSSELSHRDYLGALMNLGIKRETLGDILVHRDFGQIVVLSEIAPFLEQNLNQVARLSVETKMADIDKLAVPECKVEMKTATVASLRLDAVVAEGFNLSRSEASNYIESGKVYLQFEECTNVSKSVDEGDTISLRGMGRIILSDVGGSSKKNRIFITVRKLV